MSLPRLTRPPPPPPLPLADGYGFFTALNASHATWTFKTVQPDGNGPKDYSDALLIVQSAHREADL